MDKITDVRIEKYEIDNENMSDEVDKLPLISFYDIE